ncbi:double zinc ribbon domain-containing protein [Candidatus Omnitrophota bacterium]
MLRTILGGLKDLVFPPRCVACGQRLDQKEAIDGLVCLICWNKVKKNLPPFCNSCGRHLEKRLVSKGICPACIRKNLRFDRAFSPCAYEGVVKELIHAFKYRGKDELGSTLGRLMIDFAKEYSLPMDLIDAVVPVPLFTSRLREREFNQAEVLGGEIAREFNKQLLTRSLKRHRNTRTQTDLEERERLANVKESFSAVEGKDLKNKNILLVDDVLTTAATSSEAAHALKGAGARIVFVLTLAN